MQVCLPKAKRFNYINIKKGNPLLISFLQNQIKMSEEINKKMYPQATTDTARRKADLAPKQIAAWRQSSRTVFKEGVVDEKTTELIAAAVAHVTQRPYCIHAHTPKALRQGASEVEIME